MSNFKKVLDILKETVSKDWTAEDEKEYNDLKFKRDKFKYGKKSEKLNWTKEDDIRWNDLSFKRKKK